MILSVFREHNRPGNSIRSDGPWTRRTKRFAQRISLNERPMTSTRILSAVIFTAVFLAAMYWPPLNFLVPMIALAAAIWGTMEFHQMARMRGHEPVRWVMIGAATLWVLCSMGAAGSDALPIWLRDLPARGLNTLPLVLLMVAGASFVVRARVENCLANVSLTVFGGMYVGLPLGFLMGMYMLARTGKWIGEPSAANFLLLFLIAVTWVTDSGAYFAGRRFGKHKLCPKLSPSKTVEGFIGGFVATYLMAIMLRALPIPGREILGWGDTLILATLFAALGPLGDLTESIFKRDAGVKDSGPDLTGHGGLLDVIDSLLFTVPAAYVYLVGFQQFNPITP